MSFAEQKKYGEQKMRSKVEDKRKNNNMLMFFNNNFLSDCILVDVAGKEEYFAHRLILAFHSPYFNNMFHTTATTQLKVNLPKPISFDFLKIGPIKRGFNEETEKELYKTILMSFYIDEIVPFLFEKGMNNENAMKYYTFFYAVKYEQGMIELENYIIKDVVNKNNCIGVLLFFYWLQNEILVHQIKEIFKNHFEEIISNSDNYQQAIELPFEIILDMLQSDELRVYNEDIILKFILDYIEFREKLPEKEKILDSAHKNNKNPSIIQVKVLETEPNINASVKVDPILLPVNSNLESTNSVGLGEGIRTEEKQLIEENMNKNFKKLDLETKSGIILEEKNIPSNQKIENYKLEETEKKALLLTCRLAHVSPEFLLKASSTPFLSSHNSLFLEAISAKLQIYEKFQTNDNYSINTSARYSHDNPSSNYTKVINNNSLRDNSRNFQNIFLENGSRNISKSDYFEELKGSRFTQWESNRKKSPNKPVDIKIDSKPFEAYPHRQKGSLSPTPNFQSIGDDDKFSNQDNYHCFRPSPGLLDVSPLIASNSILFTYSYDYDDNGAVYFLGTQGKKRNFSNPHHSGLLQVFFSSCRSGNPSDLVSRDGPTNSSTQNERHSFMGIDLGSDRFLIPHCYTIRNRDSNLYVLLNWVLEGSHEGKEWVVIDKRVHLTDDSKFNKIVEKEREILKIKGGTSTWGIDTEKLKTHPHGFRYLRILQTGKNSNGSDNLCLSGLEFYGFGVGKGWVM